MIFFVDFVKYLNLITVFSFRKIFYSRKRIFNN